MYVGDDDLGERPLLRGFRNENPKKKVFGLFILTFGGAGLPAERTDDDLHGDVGYVCRGYVGVCRGYVGVCFIIIIIPILRGSEIRGAPAKDLFCMKISPGGARGAIPGPTVLLLQPALF